MVKDTLEKNAQAKVNSREIELLKKDFPQCFDKDGKFDLKAFEKLIRTEEVDIKKEGYALDFLGKSYARYLASLDSETVIVPDESNKNIDSQNVYIVGDNLDALQHLKYSYSGQIKCIYIDPPYNTGSDGFVYNDKFEFTAEELARKINIEEDEAQRVLDIQGKSTHSAWLTFMYPRLELARDLLSEDGVIFISVDDNEQANCKLLCDMVFGEGKFITIFKWNRVAKAPSLSGSVRTKYEYVICYCKDRKPKLYGKESYNEQGPLWHLPNKQNELLFPAKSIRVKNSFAAGYYGGTYQVELLDEIVEKDGINENSVRIKACSAWAQDRITEYVKLGKTFEIKKSPTTMYVDLDSEGNFIAPSDLISLEECNVKRNTDADEDMNLMGIPFEYSKPISLIQYLIKMIVYDVTDAVILDFFSGSATTAHAVMQKNINDENSHCKYILVQLDEPVKKGREAEKAGYQTIDEIGRERIRRAAKQLAHDYPEKAKNADLAFKTYYLKATDKETLDKIIDFDPSLPIGGEDIKTKFGKDTVLETWKIKDGYGFNTPTQTVDLCGYTAYLLSDSKIGTNLYLIDDMPEQSIIELVRKIEAHELNLDRIIEYGYAFSYTTNTALRSNLKTLKNRTSIEPIIRY